MSEINLEINLDLVMRLMDDPDWKQKHADACDAILDEPVVQDVITEQVRNVTQDFAPGDVCSRHIVTALCLRKIAVYAAQVARAHALGIPVDLLKLTPEEAREALLRFAQATGADVVELPRSVS